MLFDVRQGDVNVIVTVKVDRVSRCVRDFHEILKILEENNVSRGLKSFYGLLILKKSIWFEIHVLHPATGLE